MTAMKIIDQSFVATFQAYLEEAQHLLDILHEKSKVIKTLDDELRAKKKLIDHTHKELITMKKTQLSSLMVKLERATL